MEPGTLARVLHDFFTTVDEELSLPKGQYFVIHNIIDKHWCHGQSQDRVGKFPLNHLHKVEIPPFSETERLFVSIASFPGQEVGDLSFAEGELIIGVRDIGSGWCMGRIGSRNGIFPLTHTWELDTTLIKKTIKTKSIRKRAKVKTTLKAQLDEELDLTAGEMIVVTEILDDGWCRGVTEDGREGIFPEGFISYIEEDQDIIDQRQITCTTENNFTSFSTVHNGTIYKDFGEISINSYANLSAEPTPNYFDLFPEMLPTINNTDSTQYNNHTNSVDIKPYAITLYPFNAQFPNELSFGAGEVVHLTRYIDSEWLEGMIDTTKGIFPLSYVNIIVDCAEAKQHQVQSEVILAKKDALEPNTTVKVLYTFDAQMNGDLNVHEGESVTVVEMTNEDWVKVKNKNGLVGLCPREYLSSESVSEYSLNSLQESNLEDFEDFVMIRLKEASTVVNEEPKRMSQPHRPAPPAPAPGRVPLQKEIITNGEVSAKKETWENESAINNTVNMKQKNADQRQNVISELVITEKEYVRDLKLTYETFNLHNPNFLESKGIDVATLFGNILEVIHVAEELLDMILRAMKGCDESLQTVGPCFVKMAEKLKSVYVKYCGNHEAALALLKKYESNEEIMKVFNKGIETLRRQVACFDMSSILIKPIQRIVKYPLMLYELIKCTEDNHPDKAAIMEAWEAMTNVASYINEYKRRRDIVSKYLDNDNTLFSKMSKLSMHSVAKMSTRLSTRLSASLGLTNVASDTEFEELEKQFRSIEKCTWQLVKDIEQCITYLSDEAISGEAIAELLVHYYQGSPTAEVKKLQDIRSVIWSQYIQDFKSYIEKTVSAPLHFLATLLEGPAVLVAKRHDKLLDYDAAISKSEKYKESKIIQEELFTAKSNYEALNQQLLEELPILLDAAANILVNCINAFAGARKLLSGRITKQYISLCETTPHLSSQDVLESFLVNHNLIWNQITRFAFAGTNTRIDEGQTQLSKQTEEQKSLLREKYTADKLYVVVEDVASTSTLEVDAARGMLIGVIKKQDPMGNPARWYVDTGVTQGFLPSQKLRPVQRQSQHHDHTTSDVAAAGRKSASPPNLMSLDSPEKEIKKVSSSHLQDLLSLDQETKVYHNYSNVPETPRVQVYQNIQYIHGEFYYAMYDFAGNMPGTLPVTNGQALRLLRPHDEKGNDEWWLVENRNGKQGYVPRNYLSSPIKPKS
ncbi:Dynamin-binding protein [Trachymyrmex zeteki]|uniref:Dynamin-binding protein n=1 Tax=Mycetomoellerius zeteki TaxID=64791 RepID=A0A151WXS2_9HYME|nr:PREDICTED: dynamin-binding protein-like [Trachymyrmex zeteki]KYQ52690.1 Dynamin-binding protein [Trachymyrmex zeteki]